MAKWTLFIGDEAVSCEDGKYFGPEDIVAAPRLLAGLGAVDRKSVV